MTVLNTLIIVQLTLICHHMRSLLMWNYRSNQYSNTACAFTHSWIDHLIFCPRPSYLIILLRHSSFETNAPSILARLCRKVPNHHQNTWIRLVRIYLASGTMNYQFTYGGTDNLSLRMKGAKQRSWCDWSDVSVKLVHENETREGADSLGI